MHQRAEWGVAAHWAYKDGLAASDIDWLNRIIDWQAEVSDPAQFMENLKTDLEQDEVFVFTPKGRVITLPVGSTTGRLRLRRAHRGRPRVHRRQGQRPAGAARPPAAQRRHVRDLHVQGRDGRPVAGLAAVRRLAAGAQQDPAVVLPRAARRHDRGRARRAHRRSSAARACRCSGSGRSDQLKRRIDERRATSTSTRCWRRSASTTSRRAASPSSVARSFRGGDDERAAAGHRAAAAAATAHRRPTRSASTSRVSTTCSCGCRTAARRCRATRSSGSSPAVAACQRAPRRLRQRRVAR